MLWCNQGKVNYTHAEGVHECRRHEWGGRERARERVSPNRGARNWPPHEGNIDISDGCRTISSLFRCGNLTGLTVPHPVPGYG